MTLTTLDPKSALVVIDLQQGIVAMDTAPHASADVVSRSAALAEAFRAQGLPVVLVRVSGGPAVPGRIEAAGGSRTRPEGWDVVVDELAPLGDVVVTKRNWGAFYGTDLDLQLRRRGVTQIVLTGIATSIGVESTARAAHEHGYHVTFATDAMADRSAENHQHSVDQIFPRLGERGTTAGVLELLASTR
ncbi:isochorismatase family protein [Luteimicrobium subarcticum]|uniref:Nicotinamidase-related amidase n=1 Tax=Luteimicrobium subarcticum TaxID=620910 RepID=A0A2M8WVS8_9MICO|nr:isochorismatase family protein [Luteimicrobium subarcticum]PJI95030.1 nicotinamidase-related amidase [Luteimicrobium subarcticum]